MAARCVIGEFRTTCSVYGEGNVKAGGCPVVITQWSEHMQLKPRALSSISVDCKLFTFSLTPHNNKHIKCSKVFEIRTYSDGEHFLVEPYNRALMAHTR